jgi:hypothetical protein
MENYPFGGIQVIIPILPLLMGKNLCAQNFSAVEIYICPRLSVYHAAHGAAEFTGKKFFLLIPRPNSISPTIIICTEVF